MSSFAGYELAGVIGRGHDSVMWRARRHADGKVVALHMRRNDRLAGVAARDQGAGLAALRARAAVVCAVRHPNIWPVLDIVTGGDGRVAVASRYATNGSLALALYRRGWLDPGEVVAVFAPLADALSAAHELGLVHGALAPTKVLFAAGGEPMLTGFVPAGYRHPATPSPDADLRGLLAMAGEAAGPSASAEGLLPVLERADRGRPPRTVRELGEALRDALATDEMRLPPTVPTDTVAAGRMQR